jgi:hypothetical protein
MLIAPANPVPTLEVLDRWTEGFDDASAFMAKCHVGVSVVLVGAADAGGGDADEDLGAG